MTAVFVFVPTYKNQLTGTTFLTTHALSNALKSRGIEMGVSCISNPDVEWVRNFAITYWYDRQTKYSHILFIDDDMAFMPDVVLDMITFGEPVVGAIYRKKTEEVSWACSGLKNPEIRGPFLEVEGLGFGCFLIRRDAITTMLEKMPELSDTRTNSIDSDLFRKEGITRLIQACQCIQDPERGKVSEDISFGRRWRQCGGKVWAATHHKIVHVGPYEFAGAYGPWAEEEKAKAMKEAQSRVDALAIMKENPNLRAKACKYGMMIYNVNDSYIGRSLDAYGEWCEFEIALMSQFLAPGDTVIDVGANIGTHTAAFARMVEKTGKVFAFEASPQTEKILDANIQANNLGNVVFANRVVGDVLGTMVSVPLYAETIENNMGALDIRRDITGQSAPVEQITIDSFASDQNVRLIKIDVEGMEPQVIRGAVETIRRCKPVLYFEYNQAENNEEIADLLHQIGYVAFWSIGPYFTSFNFFRNATNIWGRDAKLSVNLIAIPAEKVTDARFNGLPAYEGADDTWRKACERMAHQQQAAE